MECHDSPYHGGQKLNREKLLKLDVLITIIWAIVSYLTANLLIDDVYSKMILVNIPLGAFSFAILAGFYWEKANSLGAAISILVGVISGVLSYYYSEQGNWLWIWMALGMPLVFISGFTFSYLSK